MTPAPLATPPSLPSDRRTGARYPLLVGSFGVVDPDVHVGGEVQETWPLVVQNVSAGGVGVLLARRFETGTELFVELVVKPELPPQRLTVRVVRVQSESAGHWTHGCEFDRPLTEQQLKALLKFT